MKRRGRRRGEGGERRKGKRRRKRRKKKRKEGHPWLSPLAPDGLGTRWGLVICFKLSVPMSASLFSVDDLALYFKNGSHKARTPQLVASTFKHIFDTLLSCCLFYFSKRASCSCSCSRLVFSFVFMISSTLVFSRTFLH